MLPVVHRSGEAPRTAQSEVSGDSLRSLSGGERRLPSVLQMACDDTALSGRSGRIVRHHGRHTSTPISKRSPLGLTRPVIRPRQARRSIPPQSLYQPFAGWHTGPQAVANRSVRARKDPVRLIEIGPHEVKPLTDLLRRMAFSLENSQRTPAPVETQKPPCAKTLLTTNVFGTTEAYWLTTSMSMTVQILRVRHRG